MATIKSENSTVEIDGVQSGAVGNQLDASDSDNESVVYLGEYQRPVFAPPQLLRQNAITEDGSETASWPLSYWPGSPVPTTESDRRLDVTTGNGTKRPPTPYPGGLSTIEQSATTNEPMGTIGEAAVGCGSLDQFSDIVSEQFPAVGGGAAQHAHAENGSDTSSVVFVGEYGRCLSIGSGRSTSLGDHMARFYESGCRTPDTQYTPGNSPILGQAPKRRLWVKPTNFDGDDDAFPPLSPSSPVKEKIVPPIYNNNTVPQQGSRNIIINNNNNNNNACSSITAAAPVCFARISALTLELPNNAVVRVEGIQLTGANYRPQRFENGDHALIFSPALM